MNKIVNLIASIAIGFSGCVGTLAKNELKNPSTDSMRNVKPETLKLQSDKNTSKIIFHKK